MCQVATKFVTMADKKSFWDTGFGSFVNNMLFGLPSLIGGLVASSKLTGAEREQNAFNAQQAELQRSFEAEQAGNAMQFSAEQAERQMAFQERMANTQYQRVVSDMRAAGVNPALAMSNGGAVAPSGAAGASAMPAGAAASGSGRGIPFTMSEVMAALKMRKEMKLLDAQAENVAADTKEKEESARATALQNEITEKFGLIRAQGDYDKVLSEINKLNEEGKLTKDQREVLLPAEKALKQAMEKNYDAETLISAWRAEYMDTYGADPSAPPITQALTSFLDWINDPERLWNRNKFNLLNKN